MWYLSVCSSLTSKCVHTNLSSCMEWNQECPVPRHNKKFSNEVPRTASLLFNFTLVPLRKLQVSISWLLKNCVCKELYTDWNSSLPYWHAQFYRLFYHDWHLFGTCKILWLDSQEVVRISWRKKVFLHPSIMYHRKIMLGIPYQNLEKVAAFQRGPLNVISLKKSYNVFLLYIHIALHTKQDKKLS